ncbi:hypothetical protein BZZ01_22800 [Nostocales cyanobacterium HT-58-2]|nr:hypothetical protein BZZ01_22800 [Nostocales cyanobacterium HT-58-2]
MPKTRLHKTLDNQPPQNDVFADFIAPNSTDSSFLGRKKHTEATQAHLQKKFEQEFEAAKNRLKAAKAKVGLLLSNGSIQLQATLPLK